MLRQLGTLLSVLALGTGAGWAEDPHLEKAGAPPDGVAAAVRATLAAEGIRVVAERKTLAELWLRNELPAATGPAAMGVAIGSISSGTLVGVARFPEGWSDYRGQKIAPGLYTLRYDVQPADGNHTGNTIYRDFLLLVQAADDTDPAKAMGDKELFAASKKAAGTNHAAVLSLFPLSGRPPEPTLLRNELEQWMVGASAGSTPLGLVVVGQAEAEGLH
jgi:hypothetical protein